MNIYIDFKKTVEHMSYRDIVDMQKEISEKVALANIRVRMLGEEAICDVLFGSPSERIEAIKNIKRRFDLDLLQAKFLADMIEGEVDRNRALMKGFSNA